MQVVDFEDVHAAAHHERAAPRIALVGTPAAQDRARFGDAARQHVGDPVEHDQRHRVEVGLRDRLRADQPDQPFGQRHRSRGLDRRLRGGGAHALPPPGGA